MFKKILIANRGEIACRIIKTAKKLGVKTVAVYSKADENALFVKQADEAYLLGPAAASESYLNQAKLIEIAKQAKAQAIHPGYGFLSENANFAALCEKNKIIFIGPESSAIKDMGDKNRAKEIMQNAGVPIAASYSGDTKDKKTLQAAATQIGLPVLVKAAFGGGGRGMRLVHALDELMDAVVSAEREAEKTWLAVIAVTGKEKQISLDKTLLEDMDEEQIAELITQLDKVINEIGPQAEDFKITDENTTREPLEKLYEEYIRKDEREKEQRELNQKKQEEQRQKEAAEATRRRAEEDARRLEEENKRVAQIRLAEEQKKKIEEAQRLEEERRVNEKKAIELKLAEQRRLEQKRQDAAAEAAEQAKREAEEKKRLAEEAAERAKEERARQQAEKEIANVKILSPTSEMYIHGMGWDQWKNRIVWSHRESVVAFLMARKVIIKELTQDATSEIELEDQLDFVDMAWSADDKKIAVISANHCPRRYKNNEPYDGGKASIAIWSMSQNKFEQSADIPCEMGINIVGWRGNNVLIHNSGVYTTMFTEHNKPLPVHLYDSESKTLSHPVDAYAVAWRDDNSFFFGQEHTIKLYNIATRTVTTTLEECPENGDATLFYQLCPNSLKVLRLYYSNGWLVAYTAAGDDDKRFSIWSTTAQAKQDWVKGADPDACWARGDNLIYLLLGDALYEVSPLKKNILRLSLAKDLLEAVRFLVRVQHYIRVCH